MTFANPFSKANHSTPLIFALCQKDSDLVDVGANNRLPFSWDDTRPHDLLVVSKIMGAQKAEGNIFFLNRSSAQVENLMHQVYCLMDEERLMRGQ